MNILDERDKQELQNQISSGSGSAASFQYASASNGETTGWFKVASTQVSNLGDISKAIFQVSNFDGSGAGILVVSCSSVGTESVSISALRCEWLIRSSQIQLHNFVATAIVESGHISVDLWCAIHDQSHRAYQFVPVLLGNRTQVDITRWSLYHSISPQESYPTAGYQTATSTDMQTSYSS